MKQHTLFIDHAACWGCMACEVACKQENGVDTGVKLIAIAEDGPKRVDGRLVFVFQVNVCTHSYCADFPCLDVCPSDAIQRREDGIVVLQEDLCSGCEVCIDACPYDAIRFNEVQGIAQKCNLCHHRVDRGLIPACADNICLAHCIYFGDPEEIQQQIAARRAAALSHGEPA
jgi:Fe-S-cluster-containing dehydrogenase component